MRRVIAVLSLTALAFIGAGCSQLKSRDNLNKGVAAFKNAQYPEAVERFKQAVDLDPTFTTARLYLAMAYMQQYIPGAQSPENRQMWDAAYNHFTKAVEQDPKNTVAIASIASLYLNEKKWADARRWYERLISVEPNNADAYYSLGFIAWSEWYPEYAEKKLSLGMKPDDPGPLKDKKVKEELKAKYEPVIDGGLKNLDKALEINPKYDDAMAYKNLLIREHADLLDSKADYDAQIKVADDWVAKALAVKKQKAEEAAKKEAAKSGGITAPQ